MPPSVKGGVPLIAEDGVIEPGAEVAAIGVAIRDDVVDSLGVGVAIVLLGTARAAGVMDPGSEKASRSAKRSHPGYFTDPEELSASNSIKDVSNAESLSDIFVGDGVEPNFEHGDVENSTNRFVMKSGK